MLLPPPCMSAEPHAPDFGAVVFEPARLLAPATAPAAAAESASCAAAADDSGGAGGVALTVVDDDVADGASFSESSVCVGLAQLAFPMVFFAASCVVVSVPAYSFFIDGKFIGLGTAMRAKSAGLGCAFARPSGFMFV